MRKFIDEKDNCWESWLVRKLIDEKVNWWESWFKRILIDEKVKQLIMLLDYGHRCTEGHIDRQGWLLSCYRDWKIPIWWSFGLNWSTRASLHLQEFLFQRLYGLKHHALSKNIQNLPIVDVSSFPALSWNHMKNDRFSSLF